MMALINKIIIINLLFLNYSVCSFQVISSVRFSSSPFYRFNRVFFVAISSSTKSVGWGRKETFAETSTNLCTNSNDSSQKEKSEAECLIERAQQLRDEIAVAEKKLDRTTTNRDSQQGDQRVTTSTTKISIPWSVPTSLANDKDNNTTTSDALVFENTKTLGGYRLYVDIGREPGTWMEPRWGASGRRLEFTLDIELTLQRATSHLQKLMIRDKLGGGSKGSSLVYKVVTAPMARMRQGFDQISCFEGAYRIDNVNRQTDDQTIRFFIQTKGKTDGDVSLEPNAPLYFSLPVFGNNKKNNIMLSRKEGIVSIRQMGWHTGWYRKESCIVGVFRAVPIRDARAKDGF